jgi:hypothetical protein
MKHLLLFSALILGASAAQAETITDLSGWSTDGSGEWTYDAPTNTWHQHINTPTSAFLYDSEGASLGNAITGNISVDTAGDDDLIGFALGYEQGDHANPDADYFLLTWRQAAQSGMGEGLYMWHIQGSIDDGSVWNPNTHAAMTQIGTAKSLSTTGWDDFVNYTFDISYDTNILSVFINDSLEFALTSKDAGVDQFTDGSFAFFNFSQNDVTYGGVTVDAMQNVLDDDKLEDIAEAVPFHGAYAASLLLGLFAWRRKA